MSLRPLPLALTIATMTTAAAANPTKITLYSGDFDSVSQSYPSQHMPGLAQIAQNLVRDIAQGNSEISLDRLPVAIDVGSVQLGAANNALRITSQRYDFSLLDQDQLLQQALGQRVSVEQLNGGQSQRISGTLIAAGNGLTLMQDDGRVRVLSHYSSFELERLPQGLSTRPTLRWNITAPRAGRESFQLDYATGGMAWQAEYQIRLDGPAQQGKMSLNAAAQVVNRSGIDYPASHLTLVAGSPNRARSAAPMLSMAMESSMRGKAAAASYDAAVPEVQESAEYHAYPLPHPVDLPNGSIQRVSLINPAQGIGFQRRYDIGMVTPAYPLSRPQIHPYQGEEKLPVRTVLTFANSKNEQLGIPLPAGRVRVFQAEKTDDALLGEAWIGHTPAGQNVQLDLGEAFDLSAQRKRTEHRLSDDRLSLTETVQITLHNAKSQPVTLRLHETLNRWKDWEITASSQKWDSINAQNIAFDVTVPPGKSTEVSYTVRYRWPAQVRP